MGHATVVRQCPGWFPCAIARGEAVPADTYCRALGVEVDDAVDDVLPVSIARFIPVGLLCLDVGEVGTFPGASALHGLGPRWVPGVLLRGVS